MNDNSKYILMGEYQLCPKCNGQGQVSRPPYLAGDIDTWTSNQTGYTCNVCHGDGIIIKPIHEPKLESEEK